jgi:hypothetical protein
LATLIDRYVSAATALRHRAWRWTAWAALSYFLMLPVLLPALGMGYHPALADGGPAFLIAAAIDWAAQGAVLGATAALAALVGISLAIAFLPFDRRAYSSVRLLESPFLASQEETDPDIRPAGFAVPSARQRTMYGRLASEAPKDDKGPNLPPLAMPEGQVETLRFLTSWRALHSSFTR